MTPSPFKPIVCEPAKFHREPAPVTVAVPKPVAALPSVMELSEETSPPEEIVSVPSPLFLMVDDAVIAHNEPAPLTVAAPSAPRFSPRNTDAAVVRVPPLVMLKVPVPLIPIIEKLLKSTTAFGPVIVSVPAEPDWVPRLTACASIRPLSFTVTVPVPPLPAIS